MKIKLTLFAIFISLSVFSQTPNWIWSDAAGGNYFDDATSVATDNSGNIFVCGSFYNDTIILGTDTLRSSGLSDIYLMKYNSSGTILWVKKAGGVSDEVAAAVTVDLWGNLYYTGTFSSPSITFGNTTLFNPNTGVPDIFIVKYDTNGNVIWAKKEGQSDYDYASSVVTDPVNGEIYLAGAYYANSITVGTTTLLNNGLYDELLIKYDTAGNVLWARGAGGTLNDLNNAVSIDKARNVYIAGGYASSSMTFSSTTLTNVGPGYPDIFTAKYDSLGNVIWAKSTGGTLNDHAVTIMNDTNCNVLVGGHYHSASFPFAASTLTNNGMGDIFLLKYDSAGTEIWGNSQGGTDMDFGYTVTVDAAGSSYFAGMFISPTITFGTYTLTNASMDQDMFLVKYDAGGNVVWAISAGGMGTDYINSITLNSAGNLFAAGTFGSTSLILGSSTFINADTSGTTTDMFVGKLDFVTGNPVLKNSGMISVYPNPSNGIFTIEASDPILQIAISNILGELIYSTTDNRQPTTELDLSAQPNGIYFVNVRTEKESFTQKIIVQK